MSAPIDEQAELSEISAAIAQLEPAPFGSAEEILATLHHDVGKYLTRVARNVPPGAPLITMHFQAVIRRGPGGAASVKSGAVSAPVLP